MYLAEVNEKVLRKRLKEDGRNELLAELITKKIKANKPLEQIAEEVEENTDAIKELYEKILAEMEHSIN